MKSSTKVMENMPVSSLKKSAWTPPRSSPSNEKV